MLVYFFVILSQPIILVIVMNTLLQFYICGNHALCIDGLVVHWTGLVHGSRSEHICIFLVLFPDLCQPFGSLLVQICRLERFAHLHCLCRV